ncbi:MAG: zf-HC2 domain-containing protein [Thermoanaerobaculia bacterium]|nr:zf-HC2 domain-containing protein [Thermoanaerobaculia bacterium]
MTCARVETLLALHVEGDLAADESRAVEAHMAGCPGCRAEAEAYKRSQSFLREDGPAPFDERDYAEIRRGVRERLDDRPDRGTLVRRANIFFLEGKRETALALTAAASLLLAASIALRYRPTAVPGPASFARSGAAQAEARPLSLFKKNPPGAPELTSVAQEAAARAVFPSKQKEMVTRSSPLLVGRAPASVVSRIELQTANPNVRIIWLVGSQPPRPHELETDSEDGI